MSQRVKVTGTRSIALWILIMIAAALVIGLVVGVLIIYPNYQDQQQVEQHYQAGIAFQETGDWDKAVQAFENVIAIDATYRDARSRLAEVKAKQQETDATAQAKAAQATMTAQARAEATGATATTEAEIAQATSVAATETAQTRSTAAAQQANATATAETVAQLEGTYQKCLGSINLERWEDAKTACDQVFSIDPNYKEIQTKLKEIEHKLVQVQTLTPTREPTPSTTRQLVEVHADLGWQDSGIPIRTGEQVGIQYVSGEWTYWEGEEPLTEPGSPSLTSTWPNSPIPDFPQGRLIGRVGEQLLRIAEEFEFVSEDGGLLEFRMNDDQMYDNAGTIIVRVTVHHR